MTSPDVNRERDQTGRPRNARPRDELGRPLPRGDSGVVGIPDDLVLSPQESLSEAQRLLDEGRPFHAHEVLEAAWKTAPDPQAPKRTRRIAPEPFIASHHCRGSPIAIPFAKGTFFPGGRATG